MLMRIVFVNDGCYLAITTLRRLFRFWVLFLHATQHSPAHLLAGLGRQLEPESRNEA